MWLTLQYHSFLSVQKTGITFKRTAHTICLCTLLMQCFTNYKSKILLCTTAAMEYHCSHCQVYIIYLLHFECASLGQFAGDHGNAAAVLVRGGGAVGLHWGTGRRGWAV